LRLRWKKNRSQMNIALAGFRMNREALRRSKERQETDVRTGVSPENLVS
jgi:hypothetical protein